MKRFFRTFLSLATRTDTGIVLPKIHILLICFLIAMRIIFHPRIFACKKPANLDVCGDKVLLTNRKSADNAV